MIHFKQLTLTLVALLAMTTGAWAEDQSESITTVTNGQLTYTGEHFTISGQKADTDGFWIGNAGGSDNTVTISSRNGENITKIEAVLSYVQNWGDTKLATTSGEVTGTYVIGQTITISSVNATTVTLSGPEGEFKLIEFNSWTIYYGDAPTGPTVAWNAASKTGTFTMPAGNVELQVEYYPAMLTLAASPADGGKVELDGAAAPVEWTPETWTNVSTTGQQEVTSGDITLSTTGGLLRKQDNGNLHIYASYQDNNQTFTISTEGDAFTRIEMTMEEDYWQGETNGNPHILPLDGWTFSGKSAVWEGEATKSLVCQNCTTTVSKITFYRGSGLPVGVEKDETGNIYVKKDTKVKVKATPEEGYEFASWADDATITTAEREITMGDDDLTVTANFTAKPYDVTLTAKNDYTIEAGKATVTVDGTAKTPEEGKISGVTKGQKVAITAATGYKFRSATAKKGGAAAGKTYTELKGGEVLHLGDKIEVPEADKYWYPNEEVLQKGKTYEVVRVNISGNDFEPTVTESETGAYYALHEVGTNSYKFVTGSDSYRLKVTATSDGIAVADNGLTGTGYHKYIFSVHEPAGN